MSLSADEARSELALTRERVGRRGADIAAAAEAGLSKSEIGQLVGLSRQHVYAVLARHEEAKRLARVAEDDEVEAMWTPGQVVEDRWGLRWRADTSLGDGGRKWQCRSVGLRYWQSHAQMATRGPLTAIRVDRVFKGPEATAARKAGEVEDAAVVVEPTEDTEP